MVNKYKLIDLTKRISVIPYSYDEPFTKLDLAIWDDNDNLINFTFDFCFN